MTRYAPSRNYGKAGIVALAFSALSAAFALNWLPAAIPCGLFLASAALLLFLALRPPVEIHEGHLAVGKRVISWNRIRRVDRTGWISPLVVNLTLDDESHFLLIYPGDLEAAHGLLRHLRRFARHALIDGVPHTQFWGETMSLTVDRKALPSPRYPLLTDQDEAEVERLFQRLKTVGHLDPKNSSDEK